MPNRPPSFEISEAGDRVTCGFPGQSLPSPTLIAELQDALNELLDKRDCKTISFDVAELQFIPSQMLGFLISLRNRGLEIELIDPSEFIIEGLAVTQLDKFFHVRQAE